MSESGTRDLSQDRARVLGKASRESRALVTRMLPPRLEEIRTVQDPSDHVPLREPDAMVAHGIEDAPVGFAVGLGVRGAGRTVPELGRTVA